MYKRGPGRPELDKNVKRSSISTSSTSGASSSAPLMLTRMVSTGSLDNFDVEEEEELLAGSFGANGAGAQATTSGLLLAGNR